MKKSFKSFLKYVLFSGFLSVSAVASPIASPGTSTVYSGTNSSLIYSPTVTGSSANCNLTFLVNENIPGTYVKTIDLSNFANCGSNTMLVIKAAGGKGHNFLGGSGGITILKIPLSTFIQEYGTKVTFYYLVNMGGGSGWTWNTEFNGGGGGGGGGESLVSLNNWPWNGGIPLAIGGGGGGSGWTYSQYVTVDFGRNGIIGGGDGGGGNDSGIWGGGQNQGGFGIGGTGYSGPNGGNGYLGYGGPGLGGGGGAGYGGGASGPAFGNYAGGGGGGGGFCNTSVGICEASDWTNGGGNRGIGYVQIYIESGEIPINTTLP